MVEFSRVVPCDNQFMENSFNRIGKSSRYGLGANRNKVLFCKSGIHPCIDAGNRNIRQPTWFQSLVIAYRQRSIIPRDRV